MGRVGGSAGERVGRHRQVHQQEPDLRKRTELDEVGVAGQRLEIPGALPRSLYGASRPRGRYTHASWAGRGRPSQGTRRLGRSRRAGRGARPHGRAGRRPGPSRPRPRPPAPIAESKTSPAEGRPVLDDRLEGVEVAGGLFGESMALGQRTLEEPHGVGILPPTHSETTQVTEGPGADQSGEHAAAGIAGGRFQGLQDALIERLGLRTAAVTPEGVGQVISVQRQEIRPILGHSGEFRRQALGHRDGSSKGRLCLFTLADVLEEVAEIAEVPYQVGADVEDSRRLVMQCLGQLECSSVGLFRLQCGSFGPRRWQDCCRRIRAACDNRGRSGNRPRVGGAGRRPGGICPPPGSSHPYSTAQNPG